MGMVNTSCRKPSCFQLNLCFSQDMIGVVRAASGSLFYSNCFGLCLLYTILVLGHTQLCGMYMCVGQYMNVQAYMCVCICMSASCGLSCPAAMSLTHTADPRETWRIPVLLHSSPCMNMTVHCAYTHLCQCSGTPCSSAVASIMVLPTDGSSISWKHQCRGYSKGVAV